MCARAHCRYVLPRLIKYLRKCDRGLYLSSRTSISVNVCTVRSSCRMLSNFNSPSICFSPCLVFLFYIRFGGEKNLVSIKINATKFVSVFVLLACIIVSFLFSRASHHGFQVYSSWERCFFHSLLFSLSLSLSRSPCFFAPLLVPPSLVVHLFLPLSAMSRTIRRKRRKPVATVLFADIQL